CQHYNSLPFTF
nr:immunoglobulin light chain junction region [Macaca mulatta]MOX49281.1 immunoglobulin light chain junction region [Macaca mulatta]